MSRAASGSSSRRSRSIPNSRSRGRACHEPSTRKPGMAGRRSPPGSNERAKPRTRALALAPDLAEGHVCLGMVLEDYDWDWKAADVEFRRAFELAPGNGDVLLSLSSLAGVLGRVDEAIELLRKAVALDPLSTATRRFLGLRCAMYGRHDEGVTALHAALDLNPKAGLAHCFLSVTRLWQGRAAEALEEAEQEVLPDFRLLATIMARHTLGHAARIGRRVGQADRRSCPRCRVSDRRGLRVARRDRPRVRMAGARLRPARPRSRSLGDRQAPGTAARRSALAAVHEENGVHLKRHDRRAILGRVSPTQTVTGGDLMESNISILILGASYGSLLAIKLLLAGHTVKLICLPAEAELINSEGARVRTARQGPRRLGGARLARAAGQADRRRPGGRPIPPTSISSCWRCRNPSTVRPACASCWMPWPRQECRACRS